MPKAKKSAKKRAKATAKKKTAARKPSPKHAKKSNPSQRVVKARLMGAIRRTAMQAARLRLAGKVAQAMRFDRDVDRLERQARQHGWADDALTAEERGRTAAARKKPRRENPRRPPAAWWNACIAKTSHSDAVHSPRAVCGAAWWKKPESERMRIVHALEREGTTRGRRQAYALARAEQEHRRGHAHAPKKKTRLAA